jgi:hypothetical protein
MTISFTLARAHELKLTMLVSFAEESEPTNFGTKLSAGSFHPGKTRMSEAK